MEGKVIGIPKLLLRLEATVMLVAAAIVYAQASGGWVRFAGLFLLPDISMLGYLIGPRTGAAAYNLAHTYAAAAILGAAGLLGDCSSTIEIALIWTAHIGFDRALGYGLKYPHGFNETHLGWIGRQPASPS
jgi:hypothetical protein